MCVLGVYEWDGSDPVTTGFWLLPYSLPVHPVRFWCHCRVVYLPMSHLYGLWATGGITPLVQQIRSEIYTQPYEDIEWGSLCGNRCPKDVYAVRSKIQRALWNTLNLYQKVWFPGKNWLHQCALKETMTLIEAEDEATNYIDIGPVNKTIDFLCQWFSDTNSEAVENHRNRLKEYLWLAEDGIKMQGYNGSQLWDTAFSAQAHFSIDRPIIDPSVKMLSRAHDCIVETQLMASIDGQHGAEQLCLWPGRSAISNIRFWSSGGATSNIPLWPYKSYICFKCALMPQSEEDPFQISANGHKEVPFQISADDRRPKSL